MTKLKLALLLVLYQEGGNILPGDVVLVGSDRGRKKAKNLQLALSLDLWEKIGIPY